jgi:hypothetical protein
MVPSVSAERSTDEDQAVILAKLASIGRIPGLHLFRLCSGRCRSATANNASRRAVKSQVKWHSRR